MKAPRLYPVLISFAAEAAREDGWGKLSRLSPKRATLSTQSFLRAGEALFLSFEIGGERFRSLPSRIVFVERDVDGFFTAEVSFGDEVERRRLARVIADGLASQ